MCAWLLINRMILAFPSRPMCCRRLGRVKVTLERLPAGRTEETTQMCSRTAAAGPVAGHPCGGPPVTRNGICDRTCPEIRLSGEPAVNRYPSRLSQSPCRERPNSLTFPTYNPRIGGSIENSTQDTVVAGMNTLNVREDIPGITCTAIPLPSSSNRMQLSTIALGGMTVGTPGTGESCGEFGNG